MKNNLTPRQRLFTDEFKIGDEVSITRTEHGWLDGESGGKIIKLDKHFCHVKCTYGNFKGHTFTIDHPRDIKLLH